MSRNTYHYETVKSAAVYMIENGSTLRKTAEVFGIPKSTLHNQIIKRLSEDDYETFQKVKKVLDQNKCERAYRGGQATKKKFSSKR